MSIKCLEGTTERSDGNRGRSPRIGGARPMCLEGTTPQDRPPFPPHNTTFRTAVQKLDAGQIFIAKSIKCLEGTTDQSDGNRALSPRMGAERMMCLEGTTPEDMPPFAPHNTHV